MGELILISDVSVFCWLGKGKTKGKKGAHKRKQASSSSTVTDAQPKRRKRTKQADDGINYREHAYRVDSVDVEQNALPAPNAGTQRSSGRKADLYMVWNEDARR